MSDADGNKGTFQINADYFVEQAKEAVRTFTAPLSGVVDAWKSSQETSSHSCDENDWKDWQDRSRP